jgi:hypothetical protein
MVFPLVVIDEVILMLREEVNTTFIADQLLPPPLELARLIALDTLMSPFAIMLSVYNGLP